MMTTAMSGTMTAITVAITTTTGAGMTAITIVVTGVATTVIGMMID